MHGRMSSSPAVLLTAASLLSGLLAIDLSEDHIAAAKCNDTKKPFKCHHYASCYGFQQYCTDDENIRGVAECFPEAWDDNERNQFCRKLKEGTRSLVNHQCLYACEDAFPTSKWNNEAHSEDVCTEDEPHYCPSSMTCYGFESFCNQTVQSCFPADRRTHEEIREWCQKNKDLPLHPSCKFACQNKFGNTTSEVSGALSVDDCTSDKPHYCSSSKTCYGFPSFCNETVQSCFPAEKTEHDEILEWCEKNENSPLHPSCRFACQNKFENTASKSPGESSDEGLVIAILVIVIVILVAGTVTAGICCYRRGYCNNVCRQTHQPVPKNDPTAQNESNDSIGLQGRQSAPGHSDRGGDVDVNLELGL